MVLSKSPVVVVFVSSALEILECLLTTEAQLRGAAARVCAGASGLAGSERQARQESRAGQTKDCCLNCLAAHCNID